MLPLPDRLARSSRTARPGGDRAPAAGGRLQTGLAADPAGLGALRREARKGDAAGLDASARAFESMLVGQMVKQMRTASAPLGEGMLDTEQTRLYQDLQDQELARALSEGKGLGFREALVRQLSRSSAAPPAARDPSTLRLPDRDPRLPPLRRLSLAAGEDSATDAIRSTGTARPRAPAAPQSPPDTCGTGTWPPATPADFVAYLKPHADAAARELGIDGSVLLAQSALETGWGRRIPRHADGRSSFNLFGIKADRSWQGERVAVGTLEYRNGVAQREPARFRAYTDPTASFQDYVAFLRRNPRYRNVLASTTNQDFVRGLQQAGYATDPSYANKVLGIHRRILDLSGGAAAQVSARPADNSTRA